MKNVRSLIGQCGAVILLGAASYACGGASSDAAGDDTNQALTQGSCTEVAHFEGDKFGPVSEALQGATLLKNGDIAVATSLDSYTDGQDPHVYILDKSLKKKAAFTAPHRQRLMSAPVELKDGVIVVTSLEGVVYFVDAAGKEKGRFDTKDNLSSAPLVLSDGNVMVGTWNGTIYVLGPDGTLKNKVATQASFKGNGAVAKDGTAVMLDEKFHVLFLKPDGTEQARYGTEGSQVRSAKARPDGTVVVATRGTEGAIVFDTAGHVVQQTRLSMDEIAVLPDNSFVLAGNELAFVSATGTLGNRNHVSARDAWSAPIQLSPSKLVGFGYDSDTHEAYLYTFDAAGAVQQDLRPYNYGAPVAAVDAKTVLTRDVSGKFVALASCW